MDAPASAKTLTGGCSCGAVAFVCRSAPVWTVYCHCGDCRRATGAPVTLWAGFPTAAVELSGPIAWRVGRMATVARAFCGICGSPLAYRDTARLDDEIYLAAGSFDSAASLQPEGHSFWPDRLPSLALADDLPKFPGPSRKPGSE